MDKKLNRKPLAVALGTAFAASMTMAGAASAATNPFQVQDISASSGYTQLASSDGEGSCGESNCGADKKKDGEGNCGEGSCGGDKKS